MGGEAKGLGKVGREGRKDPLYNVHVIYQV